MSQYYLLHRVFAELRFSSFLSRDENVVAVASNDVSITQSAKLLSHGSVLYVPAGIWASQTNVKRVKRLRASVKTLYLLHGFQLNLFKRSGEYNVGSCQSSVTLLYPKLKQRVKY